jgi:hypothetical protein
MFCLTCSSLSFSAKRKEKKEPKHLKQLLEISLAGLVYWGIAVGEA